MGLADDLKAQEKEHNLGGLDNSFKVKDGDNKIRILTKPLIVVSRYHYGACYEGAPFCKKEALEKDKDSLTKKWASWIIDRKSGEMKVYFMPYAVAKAVASLEIDEDWAFSDYPMPYDITITVANAGVKEATYSVKPAKKEEAVTAEQALELEESTPIENIIIRMKEKSRERHEGKQEAHYPTAEDEGIEPEKQQF